jgi:hypothetical protein
MRRRPSEFDTALPSPRAIDPRSGFNVPHSELVKEYRGGMVARRFADKPHPRDFPVRITERIGLPNARPEPPVELMAVALLWEESGLPIMGEDGTALLTEGRIVVL